MRREEDLWLELAFYGSKTGRRNIIRRIWKHPQVIASARALDGLLSRRRAGYQATVAHAQLRWL